MFVEQQISYFLHHSDFPTDTLVVAFSADVMLNKAIASEDVRRAPCMPKTVFMTRNNDGPSGYTNGFYFGSVSGVAAALASYESLEYHFNQGHEQNPYETLVKLTCDRHGIQHQTLRGFGVHLHDFVKVRANGEVFGKLGCQAKNLTNSQSCPQILNVNCVKV